MNKKRLAVIIIFLALVLTLLFVILNLTNNNNISSNSGVENNKVEDNKVENNEIKKEFNEEVIEKNKDFNDIKGNENVEIIDENMFVNKSNKIKGTKKIGNLELNDISVKYSNFETRITGIITNKENNDVNADFVPMNILDSNNKIVKSFNVYIGKIKANSTKKFDFITTANIVNLYNITFDN